MLGLASIPRPRSKRRPKVCLMSARKENRAETAWTLTHDIAHSRGSFPPSDVTSGRETVMPAYRFYCRHNGAISHRSEIAADTDEQAIAFVRDKRLPLVCELWERDRLVATIGPK